MLSKQEIRFTTTCDGVSLGYAIAGSGPPLVKTARIATAAGPDEVLVSSDVVDATADRFSYKDRRTIPAKGVDEGLEVSTLNWR